MSDNRIAQLEAEVAALRDALSELVDGVNVALEDLRQRTVTAVRDTARLLVAHAEEVRADRQGPLVLRVSPATPSRKRIETDDAGRITAVIEEPQP